MEFLTFPGSHRTLSYHLKPLSKYDIIYTLWCPSPTGLWTLWVQEPRLISFFFFCLSLLPQASQCLRCTHMQAHIHTQTHTKAFKMFCWIKNESQASPFIFTSTETCSDSLSTSGHWAQGQNHPLLPCITEKVSPLEYPNTALKHFLPERHAA